MELNRKTTLPIKSEQPLVAWLLKNCDLEELEFLADLAGSRVKFGLLTSILTKLTDRNVYEVFYAQNLKNSEELSLLLAAKRGEVAGLKSFLKACTSAKEFIIERRKENARKK